MLRSGASQLSFRVDWRQLRQRLCRFLLCWVERCLFRHQGARLVQRPCGSDLIHLNWSHLPQTAEAGQRYLLRVCLQRPRLRPRLCRSRRLGPKVMAVAELRLDFQGKEPTRVPNY